MIVDLQKRNPKQMDESTERKNRKTRYFTWSKLMTFM